MFETLPPEPNRPRTIAKSYNALLLETAQALDESRSSSTADGSLKPESSPLAELSQVEGVEFILAMKPGEANQREARGLENPERMAAWAKQSLEGFRALGERLQAGPFEQIEGLGLQRHVALAQQRDTELCVGWRHSMTVQQVREMMKKVLSLWAS